MVNVLSGHWNSYTVHIVFATTATALFEWPPVVLSHKILNLATCLSLTFVHSLPDTGYKGLALLKGILI